jgi:hypothetical protein
MNNGDKNIDQLFRDAFSSAEYPVNDALFKEALTSLPKPKPHRKIGWAFGVLATIIIGVLAYVFQPFSSNKSAEFHERNVEVAQFQYNDLEDHEGIPIAPLSQTMETTSLMADQSSTSASISGQKRAISTQKNPARISNSPNQSFLNSTHSNFSSGTSTVLEKNASASISVQPDEFQSVRIEEPILQVTATDFEELGNLTSENPQMKNDSRKPKFYAPGVIRLSAGISDAKYYSIPNKDPKIAYSGNQVNLELSFEYLLSPHWGIQSGVQYSQWEEQQKALNQYEVDNSYIEWIDQSYWDYFPSELILTDSTWWLGNWYYYDPYTDTIVDSTYVQQLDSNLVIKIDTASEELTASQRITYLEFPLLATYNFGWKRWNMQIATGISLGIFLNSKGNIVKPGDPYSIVSTNANIFQSVQYNYLLSTELGYSFNPNWQVFARPQMKVNLNSAFDSEKTTPRKSAFLGGNIGVAYRF